MKNTELLLKIEALRKDFVSAKDKTEREKITLQANGLKAKLKVCAYCKNLLPDDHPSGFCSQTCKDEYWGEAEKKTKSWTLEAMQSRILEWNNGKPTPVISDEATPEFAQSVFKTK